MSAIDEEISVLRWGGLAGILGGIVFIVVFVAVIAFVGPEPAEPEGEVMRFPDIRAARTVEDSLYLVVLILWVAHFLALYRALRETSLAPALFGSVLGIMGLGVLAAGALPHVATAPYLQPLSCSRGDTPGSGDTRSLVAGDPGHIRCIVRRRAPPRADRFRSPRGGHARGPGLWQGLWGSECGGWGGWGGWGRSGIHTAGRSSLSKRLHRRSRAHRVPSRRGMEGLQSLEGPVGSLEDRREGWRAEANRGRK